MTKQQTTTKKRGRPRDKYHVVPIEQDHPYLHHYPHSGMNYCVRNIRTSKDCAITVHRDTAERHALEMNTKGYMES